ncbi:MAG: DUF3108 domain-containing protein [Myxococcota bacterium]
MKFCKPSILSSTRGRSATRVLSAFAIATFLVLGSSNSAEAQGNDEAQEEPEASDRTEIIKGATTARISQSSQVPRPHYKKAFNAPRFRWAGEQFYFSIRLNGAEAMRASIRAGDIRKKGDHSYVPVSGNAESVGFFRNVYPMQDRADSFIDPYNLVPHRSEKDFREAGKTRTYEVDYKHGGYSARVVKSKQKREFKFNFAIPGRTFDLLSWVYDLRAQHVSTGEKFVYFIYDGWKLSRVHLEVVGKEDVYTPMGWFKTWKVKFRREIVRTRKQTDKNGKSTAPKMRTHEANEHNGYFYLSQDENLLPVKLTMKTSFGMSEAVLLKYKPAEN